MLTRLTLLLTLTLACSVFTAQPTPMDTRPADFSVRYNWYEGSLPPPYYYEYALELAPDGSGTMTLIPDYPSEDVPVWTETFTVEPGGLDALFAQLVEHGAFTVQWREEDEPPVGGSHASTTLTANGETIEIPSFVIPAQSAAQSEISDAINALVPQAVWDRLNAQREAYVEENGG
jgi:hypothetical protein